MIQVAHADAVAWIEGRDPREFAVLLIDPPYGIDYCSGSVPRHKFKGVRIANDKSTVVRDAVLEWWGDGAAAVFGAWRVHHYGDPRGMLVWDKKDMGGMGDLSFPWRNTHEEIAIYGKGWRGHRGPSVITCPAITGGKAHPHEKPVALLQALLDKAPPGPVLDLFAGSGSTAVAAARCGRNATLVEMGPKWWPVIDKRIEEETRQRPLFASA